MPDQQVAELIERDGALITAAKDIDAERTLRWRKADGVCQLILAQRE